MRNKKKKIIMIILLLAVVSLTIGFAAFSNSLTISSSSTVTPSSSTFKVRLSSSSTEFKNQALQSSPTIVGNVSAPIGFIAGDTLFIVADSGAVQKPVSFVEPGASVTYNMYIRNDGEYTAYLNSIEFANSSDASTFKVCTPGSGTTASLVESACEDISVRVTVNNSTGTQTATNATKTGIDGFSIEPGESYPVNITYSYASNGSRADGPFEVSFGTILFRYSTVD